MAMMTEPSFKLRLPIFKHHIFQFIIIIVILQCNFIFPSCMATWPLLKLPVSPPTQPSSHAVLQGFSIPPAPTAHRQACSETSPTAQKALLGPLLSPPLPDRQHLIGFKDSTQHLVLQHSQTTERSFSSSPVASRTPEQNCFPAYL